MRQTAGQNTEEIKRDQDGYKDCRDVNKEGGDDGKESGDDKKRRSQDYMIQRKKLRTSILPKKIEDLRDAETHEVPDGETGDQKTVVQLSTGSKSTTDISGLVKLNLGTCIEVERLCDKTKRDHYKVRKLDEVSGLDQVKY